MDRFDYQPLSAAFTLFAVSVESLMAAPDSAAAESLCGEVNVPVTRTGRLDCIVWWTEYQLAPDHVLSYAPQRLQVGDDDAC